MDNLYTKYSSDDVIILDEDCWDDDEETDCDGEQLFDENGIPYL